jgi:DNA repair photolyase
MSAQPDFIGDADKGREAYQYFMRTDPDMREMLGPIERAEDELTGRTMRSRLAKIAMMRGSENLKEMRVYLDPLPHIRQEKGQDLRGWYSNKGDGLVRGKRERPCMTDAILTQPYGGACTVNCGFCYINSGGRGYRGSGLVSVPLGYGEQVRRQLKAMRSAQAGYFSSFTDPFLPLEGYYHNTQAGSTAFADEGLPVFFLSRLSYPGWAFDLLKRNPLSYMQKSINTPDEEDWRKLSPGAAPLAQHFAEIKEARRRGIYVSIQCNPIIPGIVTHEDVEALFAMLAAAGANHVIVKFVEANFPWAPAMIEKITKGFGANRAAEFRDLFSENSAGQQKTVREEYRMEGHRRYRAVADRLGLTYATCFEYSRNADGTHRSVGRDFLTADTCHGHRVPFHVRRAPGSPFEPLEECPPSGCLSCADDNGGEARCGSELLGKALALKLGDLRADPYARAGAQEGAA